MGRYVYPVLTEWDHGGVSMLVASGTPTIKLCNYVDIAAGWPPLQAAKIAECVTSAFKNRQFVIYLPIRIPIRCFVFVSLDQVALVVVLPVVE